MTTYNIKDISLYWNGEKQDIKCENGVIEINLGKCDTITLPANTESLPKLETMLEERFGNDYYLLTDLEGFWEDFDWEGDL